MSAATHDITTRSARSTRPPQRIAPLFAGFGATNGFCRLCNHGFDLTPTYGNPARCPACDVAMGGPGDVGRPDADADAAPVPTPDLSPEGRLNELVSLIGDTLDAANDGCTVTRAEWGAALRAVYAVTGYTDRGNTLVGDEGAWHVLFGAVEPGTYGRQPTTARIADALDALDIIADGPAVLWTPSARQDFAAWCLSYGGDPFAFVTPASVGLTARGGYAGYRASDESSD